MSLDTPIRNCPLLLESDVLSLSAGFKLQPHALHDMRTGIPHRIFPPAEHLLQALKTDITYTALQIIATRHSVQGPQLRELLGFLNKIGGLQRKRSLSGRATALKAKGSHLFFGIRYAPLSWRSNASFAAVCCALCRATVPVVAATAVTCALIYTAGFASLHHVITTGGFGLALFTFSLLLHEMAHIVVIRNSGGQPDILQAGLRMGVIHQKLPASAEIHSSLAGPVTGATACAVIAMGTFIIHQQLLGALAIIISLFHICSLLPWYGDGKSLYHARRERRPLP